MGDRACLEDALVQFRKTRSLAERALAQVEEKDWFSTLDPETNSIAIVVKHLAGNMRSRWTDFLTTDGEKPDRNRDSEFVAEPGDTATSLCARWDEGWDLLCRALEPLGPEDLARTVTVRGEPHTVLQAVHRQVSHYSYHVGQIVLLARHFAGPRWQSLSIPRGRSKEFEVARDGTAYRPPGGR